MHYRVRLHHPIYHRLHRHQHQHQNQRQHRHQHQQHQRCIRIQPAEAAVLQVLLLTALQARVQVLIQAPVLHRGAPVKKNSGYTSSYDRHKKYDPYDAYDYDDADDFADDWAEEFGDGDYDDGYDDAYDYWEDEMDD
ncbi:MAG: hypothetical protein ACLUZ0_05925 [Coprococcus sp.]